MMFIPRARRPRACLGAAVNAERSPDLPLWAGAGSMRFPHHLWVSRLARVGLGGDCGFSAGAVRAGTDVGGSGEVRGRRWVCATPLAGRVRACSSSSLPDEHWWNAVNRRPRGKGPCERGGSGRTPVFRLQEPSPPVREFTKIAIPTVRSGLRRPGTDRKRTTGVWPGSQGASPRSWMVLHRFPPLGPSTPAVCPPRTLSPELG